MLADRLTGLRIMLVAFFLSISDCVKCEPIEEHYSARTLQKYKGPALCLVEWLLVIRIVDMVEPKFQINRG